MLLLLRIFVDCHFSLTGRKSFIMNKLGEKRIYKTMYRTSWEKNPMLKDWIQSVPDKQDKAYCKFCQRMLYAHRYSVLKHTCTTKHQQNADKFRGKNSQLFQTNSTTATCSDSEKIIAINDCSFSQDETLEMPAESHIEIIALGEDDNQHSEIKIGQPKGILTFLSNEVKEQYEDVIQEEVDTVEYIEEENIESVTECEEYHFEADVQDSIQSTPSETDNMTPYKTLSISTHILDTSRGKAAGNVPVTISKLDNNIWKQINQTFTNDDGRVSALLPSDEFTTGLYKIHFNTSEYFRQIAVAKFLYPFVEIVFNCDEVNHYHIPLLLNPFGYSTYRGT